VVPGDLEWSLKVGPPDLDRNRDARTAGLLLSTPVNPTGAVYTRSELKFLLEWAQARGLWVIVDESHRHIHFGSGPAPSVLDLPDELLERVIVVMGLSQAHSLAGWRVGVVVAPAPVARAMARLQEHVTGGVCLPAQQVAAAVLTDERLDSEVERLVESLRRRRDQVVRCFRERLSGVEFVEPLGTQYCFFRVDGFFDGDLSRAGAFCDRLLSEHGVAMAPGDAFGDERWVRLTYGVSSSALEVALERTETFLNTLAQREAV
jgi:aspartate aminotransferase